MTARATVSIKTAVVGDPRHRPGGDGSGLAPLRVARELPLLSSQPTPSLPTASADLCTDAPCEGGGGPSHTRVRLAPQHASLRKLVLRPQGSLILRDPTST